MYENPGGTASLLPAADAHACMTCEVQQNTLRIELGHLLQQWQIGPIDSAYMPVWQRTVC